MALSDWLTGKNHFEESDDTTVATIASDNGGTPTKQKESVYIKFKNPFISDTKTLRHLRHLGSSPDKTCAQTVASRCDSCDT